jgi:hypothetical protein
MKNYGRGGQDLNSALELGRGYLWIRTHTCCVSNRGFL